MRIPALSVALLLVLSGVAPAAASTGAPPDDAFAVAESGTAIRAQTDAFGGEPRIVMRVTLRDDGSAAWRVESRYALDSPSDVAAFERLGREYEAGDADAGVDADFFRRVSERVSEATGREMTVRNETRAYSVDEDAGRGTLVLEFVWTDFLEEMDGGGLRLGDAFRLPSEDAEETRTWLSLLGADQRLVIETPPGYATDTTSIEVLQRDNAIIIDGPATFEGEDGLVVTYRATDGIGGTPGGEVGNTPWALVVGGGVLAALLVVVAAVIVRRRDGSGASDGTGDEPSAPSVGAERTSANGGVGAAEPDETAGDGASDESDVDLSLLSDEERVERLLERNGGRMKQANIVKETGWSDAKVSQLLSSMADEGRVDKLRLGRENLISVPDDEE